MQLGPGQGVTVPNPVGGPVTFKVRGIETRGALTVLETEVAANQGPPFHVHANEDETLYVLEGSFRFRLGDELRKAPVGSFVYVPRGLPHCFQNVGESTGRMLVTFSPAGMERFFERFAEIVPGSDPAEAFKTAGADAGMSVLGPPLAISHPLDAR
jgi:quercetin dioxygenase-like cupin family protein